MADTLWDDLRELSLRWRSMVDAELYASVLRNPFDEAEDVVIVSFVRVPVQYRRQGYASRILGEVLDLACIYGYRVMLNVNPSWGTPLPVLFEFYSRLGFVQVGGTNWMVADPV